MHRATLSVDRMSTRALWSRVYTALGRIKTMQYETMQERDLLLEQIRACLKEIQLRGEQLTLVP